MESSGELVKRLKARFDDRNETLSFAESCTGGLLSATFSAVSGVSSFFLGSVVSYHRKIKNEILDVPLSLIQVLGEVSTPVALAMAEGARKNLGSTWAVGVTGIAGPTGGSKEKPVGMVCFGIVGPGVSETATEYFLSTLSRREIQEASVQFAMKLLANHLL